MTNIQAQSDEDELGGDDVAVNMEGSKLDEFFQEVGRHLKCPQGSRKKSSFLIGRATKRQLNGCATKEKDNFFNVRKKVPMGTKPMGAGGGTKGLSGRATKKRTFFAASIIQLNIR